MPGVIEMSTLVSSEKPTFITARRLATLIDISAVQAQHTEADVRELADIATQHGFIAAHVLPHFVPLLRSLVPMSDETLVGGPIGFPSGGHTIRTKVEVVGEGLLPTQAYANLDNAAFLQLDLSKNLYPFGKEPKVDCILYLACDELMQTPDAYISLEMLLADSTIIPRPNPSDQLVLAWEYWDGKRWRHLGLPTSVWDVEMVDDKDHLCAISRVTLAVRNVPQASQ